MSTKPIHHYDEATEEAVIGACLVSPEATELALSVLKPTDFYLPNYRLAFEIIKRLFHAGATVDEITVGEGCRGSKQDFDLQVLGRAIVRVPSAAGIGDYCEGVRRHALSRALQNLSLRIQGELDRGKDSQEVLSSLGSEIDRINARLAGKEQEPESLQEIAIRTRQGIPESPVRMSGLPSGFADGELDTLVDGWQQGSLVVLSARTSVGKSTTAFGIIRGICKTNPRSGRGIIFTTEDSTRSKALAAMASEVGIGLRDVKRGNLSQSQRAKIDSLLKGGAFEGVDVVSASGWTVEQVKACAKRHQRKYGLSCMLVDMGAHLRSGLESHGRVEHLEAVSKGLFNIAKELNVVLINTHQINRASTENDGMKPELHNLKGSGAIEEDADIVLMLHRPGYFGGADPRTEIIVKKDRLSGGAGQSCFVLYDKNTGRFKAAIPE